MRVMSCVMSYLYSNIHLVLILCTLYIMYYNKKRLLSLIMHFTILHYVHTCTIKLLNVNVKCEVSLTSSGRKSACNVNCHVHMGRVSQLPCTQCTVSCFSALACSGVYMGVRERLTLCTWHLTRHDFLPDQVHTFNNLVVYIIHTHTR